MVHIKRCSTLLKACAYSIFPQIPKDYNGPRSASALANEAISNIPDLVTVVTARNSESFFSTGYVFTIVVISHGDCEFWQSVFKFTINVLKKP